MVNQTYDRRISRRRWVCSGALLLLPPRVGGDAPRHPSRPSSSFWLSSPPPPSSSSPSTWPEINIKPWAQEFKSIKLGSKAETWTMKDTTAYWKGNPDVQSPMRMALLSCNDSKLWKAQIMRQDWVGESSSGFHNSKLSSQCNHRYKIYAEGYAWSVSLKYILACGSLALIIDRQYEDFFSRGLIPKKNYWPVNPKSLCKSIRSAVEWGNEHPSEAEAIGRRGQALMEEGLDMDRVYDYMYHLIVEYAKLQDFRPSPPSSAQEVCVDSLICLADEQQRELLERSVASPSSSLPCTLPPPPPPPPPAAAANNN